MFSQWFKGKNEEKKSSPSEIPMTITNYQRTFIPCFTKKGDLRIAIRNYECNAETYFVTVDPYTFQTECNPVINYNHRRIIDGNPGYYTKEEIATTPYISALTQFTSPPYSLKLWVNSWNSDSEWRVFNN